MIAFSKLSRGHFGVITLLQWSVSIVTGGLSLPANHAIDVNSHWWLLATTNHAICGNGHWWFLTEGYDTFENSVRDFKSSWFLISKLWFLISKLISELISYSAKLLPPTRHKLLYYVPALVLVIKANYKVVITLEEFDLSKQGKPCKSANFSLVLTALVLLLRVTSHLDLSSSRI